MNQFGATHRNTQDLAAGLTKYYPALCGRGGVVQVNNSPPRSNQRLECSLNQIFARLNQHLQPDIFRSPLFFDQTAIESEFGVRCGGKPDFDFLEATFYQGLKQLELL